MKKSLSIVVVLLVLVLMEGIVWMVWKNFSSSEEVAVPITDSEEKWVETEISPEATTPVESEEEVPVTPYLGTSDGDSENFPPPSIEVVNGRTERTIHMGVRQYVWEPATITAKKGELVRLIIHNADVLHGLVIPELGVMNIDIPSDGAVIEFSADKVGTFEFFCSYYCGEGHMEMRGKIVIN